MLGFFVQAATTDGTPLENLGAHLADPWGTTILNNTNLAPGVDNIFVWKWTNEDFLSTLAPVRSLPLKF